jgi:hypothetical protein
MELSAVPVSKPADTNFIFGQSHFIKTVEDLHEALVGTVPGIRFGIAFCEASGKRLVRWSGTDEAMIDLACQNATAIAAGHTFLIFLGMGSFPSTCSAPYAPCRRYAAFTVPPRTRLRSSSRRRILAGPCSASSMGAAAGHRDRRRYRRPEATAAADWLQALSWWSDGAYRAYRLYFPYRP